MTLNEKIEVMIAFRDKKILQFKGRHCDEKWQVTTNPSWNWSEYTYRIMPEPRVIYVNEYEGMHTAYDKKEKAIQNGGDIVRCGIKYIEVIE